MRALLAQFARFGVVGFVGLIVDVGLFNLLSLTVLRTELVHEGPLIAKVLSTSVAILCNWIGNRHWTFREHRGRQLVREGIEFALVSVGGMLIGLACLWVSHYLLGFDSLLADNISGNVIGLGLGTLFRFTLYKTWVFAPRRGERMPVFPPVAEPDSPIAEPDSPIAEPDSPIAEPVEAPAESDAGDQTDARSDLGQQEAR